MIKKPKSVEIIKGTSRW